MEEINQNEFNINLNALIIKTFKKKSSFFIILFSFLIGLTAYTPKIMNYEISSKLRINKFGIDAYLNCNNRGFVCLRNYTYATLIEETNKLILDKENEELINSIDYIIKQNKENDFFAVPKDFLKISTSNKQLAKNIEDVLKNLENKISAKERENVNRFLEFFNQKDYHNLTKSDDLILLTYQAENIQKSLDNKEKFITFEQTDVTEISGGLENYSKLLIFTFVGSIFSIILTLIREKFFENNPKN